MGCFGRTVLFLGLFFVAMLLIVIVPTFFIQPTVIHIAGHPEPAPQGMIHFSFFPFIVLLLGGVLLYLFLNRRSSSAKNRQDDSELQVLINMQEGLLRMEERIDNLEAILHADDARKSF